MAGVVSAEDKIISSTSSGGLKTAIATVGDGDTIYLKNGVYTSSNNTGISINKSITIQGKGKNVIIDAKGKNRIFNIEAGVTVTLKNMKLINGKSTDSYGDGGAIHNQGTLSISGSTFTNNQAKIDGGAIFNGDNLTITGSTFTNNQAKNDGGAMYRECKVVGSFEKFLF